MSQLLLPGRAETMLLVVDAQEKILSELPERAAVEEALAALVAGARALELPTVIAEIAPDRYGPTTPVVLARAEGARRLARTTFSALADPAVAAEVARSGRSTLVIAGGEAHVGVQQTALTALATGYRVFVARDATGSRVPAHAELAMARIASAGAIVEPVEALLLELCERSGSELHARLEKALGRR